MNFVYASIETTDIVCLLVDATAKFGHGDEFALGDHQERPEAGVSPAEQDGHRPKITSRSSTGIGPSNSEIPSPVDAEGDQRRRPGKSSLRQPPPGGEALRRRRRLRPVRALSPGRDHPGEILARVEAELPWTTAVYIDRIDRKRGQEEEEPEDESGPEEAGGEEAPGEREALEPEPERETGRTIAVPGVSDRPNIRRRGKSRNRPGKNAGPGPPSTSRRASSSGAPITGKSSSAAGEQNIKKSGSKPEEIEEILEAGLPRPASRSPSPVAGRGRRPRPHPGQKEA